MNIKLGNAPRNGLIAGLAAVFLLSLEKEHWNTDAGTVTVLLVVVIAILLSVKRPPKLPF
jgi:hypothetical protein